MTSHPQTRAFDHEGLVRRLRLELVGAWTSTDGRDEWTIHFISGNGQVVVTVEDGLVTVTERTAAPAHLISAETRFSGVTPNNLYRLIDFIHACL